MPITLFNDPLHRAFLNRKSLWISMLFTLLIVSCSGDLPAPYVPEETLAIVVIQDVNDITAVSARIWGAVTDNGGSTISDKGICWSTAMNPTLDNASESAGGGIGSFTIDLSGLEDNTAYYVRAYVINEAGTGYSTSVLFQTIEIASCGVFEGDVVLRSQEEVNTFGECNYTGITGILQIEDQNLGTPITDLSPLNNLQTIGGNLYINDNHGLAHLNGLENLTSCNFLLIWGNTDLEHLDALSNLQAPGVEIYDCPVLSRIDGLSSLPSVLGSISIHNCPALTNLNGFSHITEVLYYLGITENSGLTDLSGLEQIVSVGIDALPPSCCSGALNISDNENLQTLNGLNSLTSVYHGLTLGNNDQLTTLDSFPILTTFEGDLEILLNDGLVELDRMTFVTTADIVSIYANTELLNLDGLSGLNTINGLLRVSGNTSLTDFCGLTHLLEQEPLCCGYGVAENGYNPTVEDILNGDCSL